MILLVSKLSFLLRLQVKNKTLKLLLLFVFYSCSTPSKVENNKSLTIFFNGNIITMDPEENFTPDAVVQKNGKIIFIGPMKVALEKYKYSKRHDLRGATLIPGFIEPHLHPSLGSAMMNYEIIAPFDWKTPAGVKKGVTNKDEYLKRLKSALTKNIKKNEMFFVWGYHQLWHGDLSRSLLNKLSGSKPVGIIHRSFHEIILNDAAIKMIGITKNDFKNNPQVDWEKGHFYEGGWLSLVPYMASILFDPIKYAFGLKEMTKIIQSNGITTIAEPGFPSASFDLEYNGIKKEMSKSPYYETYLIANGTQLNSMKGGNIKAMNYINKLTQDKKFSQKNLKFLKKQVKLFSDGAIYSQLMQMKDGYIDGHQGEWMTPLGLFSEQLELYWRNGYKIHVHANGDLGIQRVLDQVKHLKAKYPRSNHQLTLHHMGYFDDAIANQCKELGVEASVNPYYLWALSDKYTQFGLGRERSENLVPIKSLISRDIPVSFHSDFSMAPLEPLKLVWTAVNRINASGKKVSQNQRISPRNALKAVTIGAAATLGLEDSIGSIEVGKKANFAILDKSPLDVPKEKIKDIKVLGTVSSGRINIL